MKALLRCGYMALIALSLVIQVTTERRRDTDRDPLATVAAGLGRLNVQADRSTDTDTLTGHSPSCEQPIHVVLLAIDGSQDGRLDTFGVADVVAKYVYLGAVEEKRDLPELMRRWLWARARFIVGLSSFDPRSDLVAVLVPRACHGLETVTWATLSPES
jgi:hypothetical protein